MAHTHGLAVEGGGVGTGVGFGSYSSQVTGLQLVTASGEVLDCDAQRHPEVVILDMTRLVQLDTTGLEGLENLRDNLTEQGYDLDKLPYVVQYNKRDLPSVVPVEELTEVLNPTKVPEFEAVATTGVGVFDTLKALAKQVLTELRKGG